MNINSIQMYKKINFFNLFIMIIGTAVIYLINKEWVVFFLLGLILASLNLLFNLISVSFILCEAKNRYRFINSFSFAFRVIIVGIVGVMVFDYYSFALIAFILGYSSQLISLVLYGINIKECEGK